MQLQFSVIPQPCTHDPPPDFWHLQVRLSDLLPSKHKLCNSRYMNIVVQVPTMQ